MRVQLFLLLLLATSPVALFGSASCYAKCGFSQSLYRILRKSDRSSVLERPVKLDKQALANLQERAGGGDSHLSTLADFGIVTSVKSKKMQWPTLKKIFERYRAEMDHAIKIGAISADDLIVPVLPFKNRHTKELILIDPITESIPDPQQWKLIEEGTELSMEDWSSGMAKGKALFQRRMADHDLGHLGEYRSDLAKMKAVRNLYRKVASGEIKISPFAQFRRVEEKWISSKDVGKKFEIAGFHIWGTKNIVKNEMNVEEKNFAQIFIAEEMMSLPNIQVEASIQKSFPEIFLRTTKPDLNRLKEEINARLHQNPSAVYATISNLKKHREKLLIRTGGGMRDSYNLERYGYQQIMGVSSVDWHEVLGRSSLSRDLHPTLLGYQETLHAKIETLDRLRHYLEHPNRTKPILRKFQISHSEFEEKVKDFIADELARVEVAFIKAMELQITTAQLVRDIGPSQKSSITYQFFNSFSAEHSLTRWAFCSP